MSIKVVDLLKQYGSQHAVDRISFEVNKGEILGFLGPNGAGKSTTMKIITGYLSATAGVVEVDGLLVDQHSLAVRRTIGYLPEHNPLYLEMYVQEYLHFVGGLYQLGGKQLRHRVAEMVDLCGLGLERHKKIAALSKGYRQRVGLAQSLLHDPSVLILDEPTTGLDPNQIVEIRKVIKEISRDKTVIFSTHIMQEVQALCDRVIIINRGRIVANDTVEGLLHRQEGGTQLIVQFSAAVNETALAGLEQVRKVVKQEGNTYHLTSQADVDCREAIFHFAVREGVALIGLYEEESSLEATFQELTQGRGQQEEVLS